MIRTPVREKPSVGVRPEQHLADFSLRAVLYPWEMADSCLILPARSPVRNGVWLLSTSAVQCGTVGDVGINPNKL